MTTPNLATIAVRPWRFLPSQAQGAESDARFHLSYFAIAEAVIVVALVLTAYLAISGDWFGQTVEYISGWYVGEVAPELSPDFTVHRPPAMPMIGPALDGRVPGITS